MPIKKAGNKSVSKPARRRSPTVDDLLDLVGPAAAPASASPPHGPQVIKIAALDSQGRPLLSLSGAQGSDRTSDLTAARSTVRVTLADVGREALVVFENNDPAFPILTGLLDNPAATGAPAKLILEAGQELVLQVGKASITLTKDGRIVIRGADVLTRSSGSNRIKGGSVHIN